MGVGGAGKEKPGSSELGACAPPPGLSAVPVQALAPLLLEAIWLCPFDDSPLPWPQALSQEARPKPPCEWELTSVLPAIPRTPGELVLSLVNTENFLEHHPMSQLDFQTWVCCSPSSVFTGVFGGRGRGGIPGTGRGQPEKKPGRQAGKQ